MTSSVDTAYRSAGLLAALLLLWGVVALVFVPWHPFGYHSVAQLVVSVLALSYFALTRKRPNRRVAVTFSTLAIVYTLLILPWIAIAWCRLGRPLEAFTVPQIATVTMPLIIPTVWPIGVLVMSAFICECMFVYFYAHHLALAAQIPVTEPFGSISMAILGISLFMMSYHRRALVRQHRRVVGELDALARVTPLFQEVRDELDTGVAAIAAEAGGTQAPGRLGRAVGRLDGVRATLDRLLGSGAPQPSTREAERALLDGDAQFVVTVFVAMTALLGALMMLLTRWEPGVRVTPLSVVATFFALGLLAYLIGSRRSPSEPRAIGALLSLFVLFVSVVAYNQPALVAMGRPYSPFLGQKLMMVALGLAAASRLWLGVGLIVFTAASALLEYFSLDLRAHKDLIPFAEPWVLLIFMLIALVALRLREQRRLASVRLLRAETEAATMHRRAMMFLALCDRLNSPLQTLVVDANLGTWQMPSESRARIRAAVNRLVALSQRLAARDSLVPPGLSRPSLDAEAELRRLV